MCTVPIIPCPYYSYIPIFAIDLVEYDTLQLNNGLTNLLFFCHNYYVHGILSAVEIVATSSIYL